VIGRIGIRPNFWLFPVSLIVILGLASVSPAGLPGAHVAAARPPVQLSSFDIASAVPRPVEETTALSVQRDYAHAWQSLISALESNRADLLNEDFTGGARQQWAEAISLQQRNRLSRRIEDHGHHVRVTFYSPDGSAMEATDTADFDIQYYEGTRILFSEHVRTRYLVLLTPGENSWKLRILQEVPAS